MRNSQKISAVIFAFLLAGVIGVGTAQADTPVGVGPKPGTDTDTKAGTDTPSLQEHQECPDPDTGGKTKYISWGPCKDLGANSGGSSANQTQFYSQYHAQPQTEPTPKQKKATPKPAATPSDAPAADVAGATDTPQPVLPLWALFAISVAAAAYAIVMRRANAFWQKS